MIPTNSDLKDMVVMGFPVRIGESSPSIILLI